MRAFVSFLVFLLLFTTVSTQSPLASTQEMEQPNVHVKLVNYLGNVNELTLHITGNYRLNNEVDIDNGKTYRLKLEDSRISLYEGSTLIQTYADITFSPKEYNEQHVVRINNRPYLGKLNFVVEGAFLKPINTLPVEDYLKGVVPSEMPASWNVEALKAQAVAARTYVMSHAGKMIDDTINYQVYAGYAWHPNSTRAVAETTGQTLTYNGKLISAVFSSSNGGISESNGNVWGGSNLVYLPVKEDPYDSIDPWSFSITKEQIDLSNKDLKTPETWWSTIKEKDTTIPNNIKNWLYQNGYSNTEIKIVSIPTFSFSEQPTTSGRVKQGNVTVNFLVRSKLTNEVVKNTDGTIKVHTMELKSTTAQRIRAMIGINTVRSYLIDRVLESNTVISVYGRGWGHGVGMSQWGAKRMADQGLKVVDIVKFYYPGTTLTSFIHYTNPILFQPIEKTESKVIPLVVNNANTEYDSKHDQIIIKYMLNQEAFVTITVRDRNNQLISTIIKDMKRQAGDRAQYWTVSSIPNGMYLFNIEAKDSLGQTVTTQVHQVLQRIDSKLEVVEQTTPIQTVTNTPSTTVLSPVTSVAKVGTQVTAKVKVNVANIRKNATTSSAIIGKAYLKQTVTIIGRSGDFYQIQLGKIRGFIHKDLLTIQQNLTNKRQTTVVINGKVSNIQGSPLQRNKTVYLPLKGVVEHLKLTYSWNQKTNVVTVKNTKTHVQMKVNSKQAAVNGKSLRLTHHPEVLSSKVYVSLRTLNETLLTKSHWDQKSGVVWISL